MNDDAVRFITVLAQRVPAADLRRLARSAAEGREGMLALRSQVSNPTLRQACDELLVHAEAAPAFVAGALSAAAGAHQDASGNGSLDVVWTGPESEVETGRLTASVVAELIGEAERELLLVSYATHDDPRIAAALTAAAERGVDITLLIERADDNPRYRGGNEAFSGFPARRWAWPADRRAPGAALHAKVIVVDVNAVMIGSANLTGRAMATNLECSVLIRGGPHPRAVRDHVWSLFQLGQFDAIPGVR